MTQPPPNGNGAMPVPAAGPPMPGGKVPVDPAAVTQELLRACLRAAEQSSSAQDTREMSEAAKAALSFAQAIVVLDPTLTQSGEPLQHALTMEALRGENAVQVERARGDNALKQAKEAAAAPTPVKRINKTEKGYEVHG